ncbi:MAG TPA: hypothetical protein PKL70_04690 [Saprospiraceae bacterium]|nr:hypothetical protein [Saprospiraceae bacterium]
MMDWFGRFHPLLVHLPVGILVLACLAGLVLPKEKINTYLGVFRIVYFSGLFFSILAVLSGLNLAGQGTYDEVNLSQHKWSGISIMALCLLLIWQSRLSGSKTLFRLINGLTLMILTLTGHLGGSMTHGPDYLSVQKDEPEGREKNPVNDSTLILEELVFPVLQARCLRCHQDSARNGGLDLRSVESFLSSNPGDPVIEAGDAVKSELFKRVALPAHHPNFMPPNGLGLSYSEIRLLEWWINLGAPSNKRIADLPESAETDAFLKNQFGLRSSSIDPLAGIRVEPASPAALETLDKLGFAVRPVSSGLHLLDVVPKKSNEALNAEQWNALLALKDQVAWLNLAGTHLNDQSLSYVGQMTNLRKLRLERNQIGDQGIKNLESLVHLEYLNLYGNGISDACINSLAALKKLKELYLGETAITDKGIQTLKEKNPGMEVIGDIELW